MSKIFISKELKTFLNFKDFRVCKKDCWTQIVNYIVKNKLHQQHVIRPTKELSNLLHYEDYIQRVLNGRVAYATINPITGDSVLTIEQDTNLTFILLEHLLEQHFKENINIYNQAQEDIVLLKMFLNNRISSKYVLLEILERFEWSDGFKSYEIFRFL